MPLMCCFPSAYLLDWDSDDDDQDSMHWKRNDAIDITIKDRSAFRELSEKASCYSFGHSNGMVATTDSGDESLAVDTVREATTTTPFEPPLRLITFPKNPDDRTCSITMQTKDFESHEYAPNDLPRSWVEPLRHGERSTRNKLHMIGDSTRTNSVSPKNRSLYTHKKSSLESPIKHANESLRMVEIYKDPLTGRKKTKIHHIGDVKKTTVRRMGLTGLLHKSKPKCLAGN